MQSLFLQIFYTAHLPSFAAAPAGVIVLTKMPSFSIPASAPTPMPMILKPKPSGPEKHVLLKQIKVIYYYAHFCTLKLNFCPMNASLFSCNLQQFQSSSASNKD